MLAHEKIIDKGKYDSEKEKPKQKPKFQQKKIFKKGNIKNKKFKKK